MFYDCSIWNKVSLWLLQAGNNPFYGNMSLFLSCGKGGSICQTETTAEPGLAFETLLLTNAWWCNDLCFLRVSEHSCQDWWRLTWWQVMRRAVNTKIPETPLATTVFKKKWSSMIVPFAVRMMVMLETSALSGRIGASRWMMEIFSTGEDMTSAEMLIWNKHTHIYQLKRCK